MQDGMGDVSFGWETERVIVLKRLMPLAEISKHSLLEVNFEQERSRQLLEKKFSLVVGILTLPPKGARSAAVSVSWICEF